MCANFGTYKQEDKIENLGIATCGVLRLSNSLPGDSYERSVSQFFSVVFAVGGGVSSTTLQDGM